MTFLVPFFNEVNKKLKITHWHWYCINYLIIYTHYINYFLHSYRLLHFQSVCFVTDYLTCLIICTKGQQKEITQAHPELTLLLTSFSL